MLLRGSSWQEVCDTAAATLPGVIYVQCITKGLNPAPDMQDPAISHAETAGLPICWVTGQSKCCLLILMPPLISYWQAEVPISTILFRWWHFKCSKHFFLFSLHRSQEKRKLPSEYICMRIISPKGRLFSTHSKKCLMKVKLYLRVFHVH